MSRRIIVISLLMISGILFGQDQSKELSLSEALKTAIERNLDIQLQRINVETSGLSLKETRAVYEPTLTSTLTKASEESEATQFIDGRGSFTRDYSALNTSLRKQEDFGMGWSISFNNSLSDSTSSNSLGETYSSSLTFGFEQQLLKGFSFDKEILRYDEYIARGNLEGIGYDLETQAVSILQQTENAYWDLVGAIEQLKVKHESLELAKQLYEQNKVKIEVGTLASIELVKTQATIADRETEIVSAENAVLQAEDRLKKILNLPIKDWGLSIKPTDPLVIQDVPVDFSSDVHVAFASRSEMKKNNINLRNSELTRKRRENELRPELKFSMSYTGSGASIPSEDSDKNVIASASLINAVDKARFFAFPGWQWSLDLGWKPFNKAAKIAIAKSNAEMRTNELNTEKTKLDIAEEVRSASRELQSSLKSIRSQENNLTFQRENLKAELQKFQNGLSTNYVVSEAQSSVTNAESQLNSAKITYVKAVVEYYRAIGKLADKRNIHLK